jgi:hypothetical protein
MLTLLVRSVSPSSSRFPGDAFGQKGREAVGHGHRNNEVARCETPRASYP